MPRFDVKLKKTSERTYYEEDSVWIHVEAPDAEKAAILSERFLLGELVDKEGVKFNDYNLDLDCQECIEHKNEKTEVAIVREPDPKFAKYTERLIPNLTWTEEE